MKTSRLSIPFSAPYSEIVAGSIDGTVSDAGATTCSRQFGNGIDWKKEILSPSGNKCDLILGIIYENSHII